MQQKYPIAITKCGSVTPIMEKQNENGVTINYLSLAEGSLGVELYLF